MSGQREGAEPVVGRQANAPVESPNARPPAARLHAAGSSDSGSSDSGTGHGESDAVAMGRQIHVNMLLATNRSMDTLDQICSVEGLTHAQYVALWTLCLADDADVGIPVSAVSDGLLNRASDTTRLLDRLQKLGLVERLPNPADRRGVLVRATDEGRRRFEAVTPKLQAFHSQQWTALTPVEQRQLSGLLDKVLWDTPST